MSETRALSAALSGPVFHGAATRSALHASERHVARWAPEGADATRSGGMRSLGFADRIAMPWMSAAMSSRGAQMMARPTADRGTPEVSWLFPRPWFQDELDWMAAARQNAEATPSFLTTRGTYATTRTAMSDVAMPMLTADMVAPSMSHRPTAQSASSAPSGPGVDAGSTLGLSASLPPGFAQVQHSLRTFSPMVPFAAASAAEVVAGTIGMAAQSGLASAAIGSAGRSPILSGLTMVAPSELGTIAPATSARFAPSAAAPAAMPSSTRAMFEAAKAQVARVDEVRQQPAAVAATVAETPAAPGAVTAAESPVEAAAVTELMASRASDRSIADASTSSPDVARALRTVDLLFQASSASSPSSPSSPSASASSSPEAAVARSSFEPSAGPRVAMPAGMGGLVTAFDAQRATTTPLARMSSSAMAPMAQPPAPIGSAPFSPTLARVLDTTLPARAPAAEAAAVPAFAPVWAAPSTAFGSIASERARAIDHVAWSDRWIARFVGASPMALAALDSTRDSLPPELRSRNVAGPEQVYLQPPMPAAALAAAIRGSVVQPLPEAKAPARPVLTPGRALRIDDDERVSDDIFAAINAASAAAPAPRPALVSRREEQTRQESLADRLAEARPQTPADVVRAGARLNLADLVAISPPPAPDAGLSPGLASSPMAPAMAGVLPMPAANTFDPRALFPEAVSAAYLGGFLARSAAPIGVVSSSPTMQALISAASFASITGAGSTPGAARTGAAADAGFVGGLPWVNAARAWSARDLSIAPASLRLADAAPARVVLSADVDAFQRGVASPTVSAAMSPAAREVRMAEPPVAPMTPTVEPGVEPVAEAASQAAPAPAAEAMPPAVEAELLTLRAALFAAPGPTSTPLAFAEHLPLLSAPTSAPSAPIASSSPLAGADELTLPAAMAAPVGARGLALPAVGGGASMIGSGLPLGTYATGEGTGAAPSAMNAMHAMQSPSALTSSGRPGSLAELILSWSIAEERAVADLAFDFVAPEMVLAAKVYGLGPAAAAQASRLAISGPGAIASLATSVDLTFLRGFQHAHAQDQLQQLQAQAQAQAQRGAAPEQARFASSSGAAGSAGDAPVIPPELAAAMAPSASAPGATHAGPGYAGQDAGSGGGAAAPAPSLAHEILGGARLPRGAFLWPEATVAALGLRALSPDGLAGMPVVALELLAAAAVADLGTWVTAFPAAERDRLAGVLRGAPAMGEAARAAAADGTSPASYATYATAAGSSPASPTAVATRDAEAGESAVDVLAPELTSAPRDVRAQFEAIYIALARSGEGQMLSPSARAAKAMSLLARNDGGANLSPRERALAAWSVMPQVYQGDLDMVGAFGRGSDAGPVEGRSGLAGLAARAGESLASFVSPSSAELGGWDSPRGWAGRGEPPVYVDTSASRSQADASSFASSSSTSSQAASIAHAFARPGRTFAQTGGGEPEIPAWFESAARLALEQRSPGAGMSMAELVLVTAAATPSRAIAAATRGASSTPAPQHTAGAGARGNQEGEKPDVDKLAHAVYLEVLNLLDIARMRSGDPYK